MEVSMPIINWDEKFSVSNEEIDSQHKKLVKLINDLFDSMRSGKSKEVLDGILTELIEYTDYHFKSEEKAMEEASYPELPAHIKIHDSFVSKVLEFKKDFDEGNVYISLEIINFLKDWILDHILKEDKKYVNYI
jgi:hemerythrin-like metal-binding protein